jgi:hypothetical protein
MPAPAGQPPRASELRLREGLDGLVALARGSIIRRAGHTPPGRRGCPAAFFASKKIARLARAAAGKAFTAFAAFFAPFRA